HGTNPLLNNHAYMFSEQERLQAEYENARRRLQAIDHVMYRHDDVVLTLQLLAYLTKMPAQRPLLHECPLLYSEVRATNGQGNSNSSSGSSSIAGSPASSSNNNSNTNANSGYATPSDLEDAVQAARAATSAAEVAGIPSVRRNPHGKGVFVDVFSIVEKFAFQKTFPSDMVYWSSIVMRNSCRRDESKQGLRQCAYLKCQKWERQLREFSKCRRCRKAKYCSKVCQSKAWQEGHRNWCTERNPPNSNNPGDADGDAVMDGNAAMSAAAEAAAANSVVALAGDTIFEDRTSEINGLTNQVKQQIATVNGKILALQALQRRQNGGSAAGRQATEHHSNVVVSLQSQLASTSTVFKDVLELRSESLKASGNRKEQFIGTAAAAAAAGSLDFVPAGVRNRRRNDTDSVDSPLYQMERKKSPNVYGRGAEPGANGAASNNDDFVALSLPDVDEASSSQMMLLQQQQSSYLDSRSDAISSIESTISELGQIFQQLAQMVSEQRDVVQRIDANVESIDVNIGAAQNELLRYYTNISSNRWLMAKIFLVILVFAFLLVMLV
ncbi:hypothetical protein GGI12_003129, partial [Dipsacomyces acuminosporus]